MGVLGGSLDLGWVGGPAPECGGAQTVVTESRGL